MESAQLYSSTNSSSTCALWGDMCTWLVVGEVQRVLTISQGGLVMAPRVLAFALVGARVHVYGMPNKTLGGRPRSIMVCPSLLWRAGWQQLANTSHTEAHTGGRLPCIG